MINLLQFMRFGWKEEIKRDKMNKYIYSTSNYNRIKGNRNEKGDSCDLIK